MKKTLVSALAAAFVIGTASTTLAAANPFSDVPRDHWAYDAVTQLAADGIIEGYGDGTYRGDRNITRYEMAQMTAKAMAKGDMSASDRALVDRLAAEFADELQNLGVRVANLEKHADMVKWNGKLEYTYTSQRGTVPAFFPGVTRTKNVNEDNVVFRLEPSAEVNNHWHVHARLDAGYHMDKDDSSTVTLKRAWAQGDYDKFTVKLGKMELVSGENYQAPGSIVLDQEFSGAEVTFGKDLKVMLQAGRMNLANSFSSIVYDMNFVRDNAGSFYDTGDTANYQRIGLQYDKAKWIAGADYYRLNSSSFWTLTEGLVPTDNHQMKIWGLNLGYRFDKNSVLSAAYAHNSDFDNSSQPVRPQIRKSSYQITYAYKGAEPMDKGSWGAYASYRYLGAASVSATQDGALFGTKGIEIGTNYTLAQNIVLSAKYFRGKRIDGFDENPLPIDDRNVSQLFGRVEFLF